MSSRILWRTKTTVYSTKITRYKNKYKKIHIFYNIINSKTNFAIIILKNLSQSVPLTVNVQMTRRALIIPVKTRAKNHQLHVLEMHYVMYKNTDQYAFAEME